MMRKIIIALFISLFSLYLYAQENFNLELLSNFDYGPSVSDVWGFVADAGTEYAIVGNRNGTSIVSLEDPENPIEVEYIGGANSIWRDMKSWDNYVYVTADQGTDGLLIIDMSGAPDTIHHKFWKPNITINNNTVELRRCHNLYIDENGYAYLSGCNMNSGGILIIDVHTDPWNPQFVGAAPAIYSHDNYVLDGIMYSSEIYAGEFTIYDVSDPTNVITLGSQNTSSNFTHNAWASHDNQYLFTTDEVANAFVDAYDVSDPDNIIYLSSFRPKTTEGEGVIPHNAHYHNGYLIVSWYTDGVIVLDVHRPENMIKVGQYDTYLGPHGGFNGCWGATPFLPSGLVLASDIQTGLYVLQPNYVRASYLEGQVTSAVNGANIANVEVEILDDFPNGTSSGADGLYKTGLPKTGTFFASFNHPEYIEQIIEVELEAGEITILDVELQPLPCIPPSSQAFNFNLLNVQPDQLEVGWMRGNGNQVIVLAKEGSPVDSLPEGGQSYQANSEFGLGDMIGNGNYVVYIGTGNSITVSGLIEQTFYGFAILEFFNADFCYATPPLFGNGTTGSFTSDVQLEKDASVSTAFPGDTVVFSFQIFNNGPGEAVDLSLTDSLPDELVYVSSDPSGSHQNGVVNWNLGNLNNGQNLTISLTTVISNDAEAGVVTNNANIEITNNDPNPSNNSDQAEVEILCLPNHECQENITVYLDSGSCTVAVEFEGEGCSFNSGDEFGFGGTPINCNFVNSCGVQDSCSFTITVLDTIAPVITQCPIVRNITGCSTDDLQNPVYSNVPTISDRSTFENAVNGGEAGDNCAIVEYSYVDEQITDCPFDFTRTWTVVDTAANTTSCEQMISIQAPVLSLICPDDQIVEVCPDEIELEFIFAEWLGSTQVNGGCNPNLEHDGEDPPLVCGGVISVTFTVMDDCGQSVQCGANFSVESSTPSLLCPENTEVSVDQNGCFYLNEGSTMDTEISGVCGEYLVEYSLTGATEGSGLLSLNGVSFNLGTTAVMWNVSGECVNLSCSFEVLVQDTVPPIISCPADTTIELSPGLDSVWLNLDEALAEDNCNGVAIENNYNDGGAVASDYYFPGVTVVTFTAVDASGNAANCSTKIEVLLEGGFSLYTISGSIHTFKGEAVSDVKMIIEGSSEDTLTVNSNYLLQFIEGSEIKLIPEKEDNWQAGLSTFDLALIQRHILHMEQLPNPYAIIAADANNDQKINTMDLILLQNIILGNINQINGNIPWRFIDASFEFDEPDNPLDEEWPMEMVFEDLDTNYVNQDWVAIKTGDVNGSWEGGSSRKILPEFPVFTGTIKGANDGKLISFLAGSNQRVSALQMTLDFDYQHIVLDDILPNSNVLPGFSEDWISISADGVVRLLWYSAEAVELNEGDVLFSIGYSSSETRSESPFSLSDKGMGSLIFSPDGDAERMVLNKLPTEKYEGFVLYQNSPNPFMGYTHIEWRLPRAMEVKIEVTDGLGRSLYAEVVEGNSGLNTRKLVSKDWPAGLLFYRVSADGWSATRKMVILD